MGGQVQLDDAAGDAAEVRVDLVALASLERRKTMWFREWTEPGDGAAR